MKVGEALKYQEPTSKYTLMARQTPVVESIAAFETHIEKGDDLDAIIITRRGKSSEGVLGIVTASDMPKLIKCWQRQ